MNLADHFIGQCINGELPMTKSMAFAIALIALLAQAGDAQQPTAQPGNPIIHGVVRVADQIKLPAKEPGVLVQLAVKEGTQVKAGQVIAKIDDSEPQMKKVAALADYKGAYNRWQDDVEIRFAQAQAAVAKIKYEKLLETNKQALKSVPEVEINEAKLDWDHFKLAIEKSIHDKELAKFEALSKQAEFDAAELAIKRRTILAPFDGVVEEIKRKQEEWVQPGDTILTLLRLDTMHVDGAIEQSQYDPNEIQGCDVAMEVKLARDRKTTVRGKIVKVSNLVRSDGMYNVRAEVANLQEHGTWVVRDGLPATLTIQLGTGASATARTP
jgi:multidrug efflux pump subunit AcrA (membrane-fusion protein)